MTGKVSINYNISPDHLLYATAARGYKAGSYNSSGLPSYEPEHVWSYEAGLKSKLFDRHLQIQLAAFDSEYTAGQCLRPAINAQYVQNAGNARIYGVEAQAQAVFGGLSIDGSVAL